MAMPRNDAWASKRNRYHPTMKNVVVTGAAQPDAGCGDDHSVKIKSLEAAKIMKIK